MKAGLLFMINKNFNNRFTAMILVMVSLVLLASVARAQAFPFTQRKKWDGPYDVRMISAPNLEAVYLNDSKAASGILQADSIISNATIRMTGNLMEINNRYKGGSPFVQIDIPQQALMCKNPEAACMLGLTGTPKLPTCPMKYNSPTYITKYVSMAYPDYDTDMSTFSSSMAQLDIPSCATIEAAYLYWAGDFAGSNPAITLQTPTKSYSGTGNVFNTTKGAGAAYRTVKFKRPGGTYQNVTAITTYEGPESYVCVGDVTTMLQGTGGGQFWAANISSYPNEGNGGSTSGWTLFVVFKSPLSPPRLISLWDGFKNITVNNTETFTLTGLQAPSTVGAFQSYVGFAALDGENLATQLAGADTPETLGFTTNNGGSANINPFCDGSQPKYHLWSKKGYPAQSDMSDNLDADGCKSPVFDGTWATACDGVSSSHITTYDQTKNTNGNELTRLPTNVNTLGYDAHFFKLPNGAVGANATQATLTVSAGPQGSTLPFMAFVAIERLQPKLEMTKASDVDATGTNTVITYTLKVKNKGNDVSLGGDIIRDTLDLATTYITGSLITTPASSANMVSGFPSTLGDGRQVLNFNVSKKINAGDSISIVFKVRVKDYASNINLWDVQCKRTITNTAWIAYNTLSSGILISKSNGNDCGIGSETRVLIQDPLFAGASTTKKLGPFNACPYITESVLDHVRAEIKTAGVPAADILLYDIRNSKYDRVQPADTFGAALNVSFFAIKDNNTTGNCQDIYEVQYKTCTLPLDMLSFTGQWTPGGARLNWVVAKVGEGDYFIVERSGNGHQFFPVGRVNTKGSNNYSFIDAELGSGATYYRLVYVAANGNKKYTNTITLENNGNTDLSIYPNPFAGTANLIVQNDAELPYDLRIVDLTGKVVHSSTGHFANETIVIGKELTAGTYLVEIVFESYKLNSRFVKMN